MSAPDLEVIVARVRTRLARMRTHLHAAFAGRERDPLYTWRKGHGNEVASGLVLIPLVVPPGLTLDETDRREWRPEETLGLDLGPVRTSPVDAPHARPRDQETNYLLATGSWRNLPTLAAWREAVDHAHATTGPTGDDPTRFTAALDRHLRETGALAADALPLSMTIAEGLARLDADAEILATETGAEIRDGLALVPAKLRAAVGARDELVTRWPWPVWPGRTPPGRVLGILLALLETFPRGELAPGAWWPDVAPLDVATWAAPLLKKTDPEMAAMLRASAEAWRATGRADTWAPIAWARLAALYATLQMVERDAHRRAVAIDAGRAHHDLLMGLRDMPKDLRQPLEVIPHDSRIELLGPGLSVQLELELDPDASTGEAFVKALRTTRGWRGLRHWAAMQRLLSVEGSRAGWVRWTLDGHLRALGTPVKNRTKADVRAEAAHQVEAFTRLELAAYAPDGTLRERAPLFLVGRKYDRLQGSEWKLDGMQLTINMLLYSGVRRRPGGRLGHNWHPAAVELAQVDEVRHPYTIALGLILPIRWRLALNEHQQDHITLTGAKALRVAGVPYRAHDPNKAWVALERDLAELQRIGGMGRWEWDAADTPRTLAGRLHLWPAAWMLDRTLHEVRPRELPPGPAASVFTGAELKAWRTRHRLTQAQAAEKLSVSRPTIARAEAHPTEALTPTLTAKVQAAGA